MKEEIKEKLEEVYILLEQAMQEAENPEKEKIETVIDCLTEVFE